MGIARKKIREYCVAEAADIVWGHILIKSALHNYCLLKLYFVILIAKLNAHVSLLVGYRHDAR